VVARVPVIVGRTDSGQENSQKKDDSCRISAKSPQPRDADREEGKIRDDVPEVRNAEYGALVGELVIGLILRNRGQQQ
jgi:hypothetical protein